MTELSDSAPDRLRPEFYGLVIVMCRDYFKLTPEEVSKMFSFEKTCAAYRIIEAKKTERERLR